MSSNLKKQFMRVSQKLDQTLGRAEKTEVLSEEQQDLERRVDLIHKICQSVCKKLQMCLYSQGLQMDAEKRMKRIPSAGLSHCLIEAAVQFGLDTTSGQAFQWSGDAEGVIAMETLQMEVEVENQVLATLSRVLDVDAPSIQKLRKQLTSRTLDMDAARTRYGSVHRQIQQSGAGAGSALQSKLDIAREEVEDCVAKVEQTRDQLATEMYQFVAKQSDLHRLLLVLAQLEHTYHQRSMEALQRIIPQLQQTSELTVVKPVFGLSLEEHLQHTGRDISTVIEQSVVALHSAEYEGLTEEGLFRIAGGTSKMRKLRAAFNASSEPVVLTYEEFNPHVISSVLKQYLRELPEPLMTFQLYSDWLHAAQISSTDQRLSALRSVIDRLPTQNYCNLSYLIKFLAKLAASADVNKMSPSNLALVIAPNLLWSRDDSGLNMQTTGLVSSLVESLITHSDTLFQQHIDFTQLSPHLKSSSSSSSVMRPQQQQQQQHAVMRPSPTAGRVNTVDVVTTPPIKPSTAAKRSTSAASQDRPRPAVPPPVTTPTDRPAVREKPTVSNKPSTTGVPQRPAAPSDWRPTVDEAAETVKPSRPTPPCKPRPTDDMSPRDVT